jgi:DNA polymerase V
MELRLTPARASEVLPYEPRPALELPMFLARTPAGFASPADDFVDRALDLNELCIRHPAATFFVRVEGDSMEGAGIREGDVLVVDRAVEPADGRVVVAALDGALLVKRLRVQGGALFLASENDLYPDVPVGEEGELVIWGVVTHVIHALNG